MRSTPGEIFRATLLRLSLSFVIAAGVSLSEPAFAGGQPLLLAERARYLMGTICEAAAYGEGAGEAIDAAFDEIARLESLLSDYRDDSELSRMNRQAGAAPFACSRDLYDFLEASVTLSRRTGGAFDPTVAPLVQAWDLRGEGRLLTRGEIRAATALVGAGRLLLDPARRTVRFAVQGMGVDPGAIGKGYALDAAGKVLRERGVTRALIDFGGQVLAIGTWEVDIAHPLMRQQAALTISLRDESASTSGVAERGVRVGGRMLGHIVDPRSGRPSVFEGSATVISKSATQADALSTALVVMGHRRGLRWADEHLDSGDDVRGGVRAVYLVPQASGALRVTASASFHANNPVRMVRTGLHTTWRNR